MNEMKRREFLEVLGGASAAIALSGCASGPAATPTRAAEIAYLGGDALTSASATTFARAIRTYKVSSEMLVDAHLARIAQVNPRLNAVVQINPDAVRAEARAADRALERRQSTGPLHGVPFSVKDTLETQGVICTGGTTGRAKYVPKEDCTVVARMRKAGAVMLGKTNVPELAAAFESDNLVYGRTNNPYDVARTPGGSSGGEAAIIAAGGSPFGLGTDAGGSIRLPAHFCGVAALKPTAGRIPRTGQFPFPLGARTLLSHVSLIARHVEDLSLMLPIVAGPDWRDHTVVAMPLGDPREVDLKTLRVAFYTDNGIATCSPATVDAVRAAARALSAAGAAVEEARPPGIEQSWTLFHDLFRADGGAGVQGALKGLGTVEASPLLKRALTSLFAPGMSTGELLAATARWDIYRNTFLRFMEKYDAVLSPVATQPAMLHGTTFDNLPAFSYGVTYNLTGWPTAAVRAGTSPENLPIGVQIAARPWREDVALALAGQVESALGGWRAPA